MAPALSWGDQTFTNVTVPAQAEISGAGNAGLPDSSGVAPIMETLPPGTASLTITSVTGLISLNSQGGFNDPDGTIVQGSYGLSLPDASYMNSYGGISGITGPGAGFLVGVFTPGVAPTGAAPPSLDFVSTDQGGINPNFTSLSPQLYQVFYIGDGLTGDGSGAQQQFIVPAGATTLYLGISDAPGFDGDAGAYGDNSGSFTVNAVASAPAPVITSPATASGTALAAFSYQITADNQPTSFGALNLPAGLTLDAGTGLISGTLGPAAGVDQVTLSATNAAGTGTAVLTLTVAAAPVNAPVISSASSASGQVGQAFSYQITASNTPTSYSAAGLPSGLNVDASAGLISGTPTQAGTFSVTLSAANAGGAGTAGLTLTIAAAPMNPPVISSPAAAKGQVGKAFSYQIAASNSPTSYSAAGLPPGLSVSAGAGLISGTPTQAGTFSVTLSATNSGGAGMATVNLVIVPALPVASIAATVPEVTLGSGKGGVFTVSLSEAQTIQLTVAYTVKGTAINGVDYVLLTGKKKFKAGIVSRKINIQPLGDLEGAAKKTVKLTLTAGPRYTVGAAAAAKVKILAGP